MAHPTPTRPSNFRGIEEGFPAVLTDIDAITGRYSWVVAQVNADGSITQRSDLGSGGKWDSAGFAVELTGCKACIVGDVVWLMPSRDQPYYTFFYRGKARQATAAGSAQAIVNGQTVPVMSYLGIYPPAPGQITIRYQYGWPGQWVFEYVKCQAKNVNFPHCPCLDKPYNNACWWSSCTVTISVSDPPPPPDSQCYNTCTLFSGTVTAAKLSGYACSFSGSIQRNFSPPCYDVVYAPGDYAHQFWYNTLEVLVGATCGASLPNDPNLQPGQAYMGFSCRIDLKEYFDGLIFQNGQWIREMIPFPMWRTLYTDNVSKVVNCGQPFSVTIPIVNSSNNSFSPTPCSQPGGSVTLSFS